MKNWSKTEFLTLVVLALPFIYLGIMWDSFPERMPIHYNFKGEPDRYSTKAVGLLVLPFINIGLYFLLKYLPQLDPKKENLTISKGSFNGIRLATHVFLLFIFFLTTTTALKAVTFNPKMIFIGMALFFLVLGNYLSAVRPNYFVGVRTPWTLENETVWKKTHRFTGRFWVIASAAFIVITLLAPEFHPIFLILFITLTTVIPIVYSYLLYQKITKSNHPNTHF